MNSRKLVNFAILFALAAACPALAWHDTGHRATAYIAWDAMDQALRDEVSRVLQAHPRFTEDFESRVPEDVSDAGQAAVERWYFAQAATWPDLIQGLGPEVRRQYNRSRWHYINLPAWLTPADRQALEGRLEHNMSTEFTQPLRQNLNVVQALKGNLEVWHDPASADADRAVALCWILHLTGDMHQPLHNVALFSADYLQEGDRGGNLIDIRWGFGNRNLHTVWDGLPTDMHDLSPSVATARKISDDIVDTDSIDVWAREHAELARRFVYTEDLKAQLLVGFEEQQWRPVHLSEGYLHDARDIARQQVNLAGHRILKLLQ